VKAGTLTLSEAMELLKAKAGAKGGETARSGTGSRTTSTRRAAGKAAQARAASAGGKGDPVATLLQELKSVDQQLAQQRKVLGALKPELEGKERKRLEEMARRIKEDAVGLLQDLKAVKLRFRAAAA